MAKTSYRAYWWLIQAMEGEFGPGGYMDGRGYSLDQIHIFKHHRSLDMVSSTERDKFRQDFMRWRANIYNDFGLAILMNSTSGNIKGKGNGGYFYFLANPEILDENNRTLRDLVQQLADREGLSESKDRITLSDLNKTFSPTEALCSYQLVTSYSHLSDTNTSPSKTLGQENLALVQFAMKFGEVLTIKFGKARTGIDIDAPYSFEPYQVKETEGRWYAIGNLYPLGHRESAELAVYDLDKMELAYDDENPDVAFEPAESFDYIEKLFSMSEYMHVKNIQKVIQVILTTSGDSMTRNLRYNPLCSAQEEIGEGQFRAFIRPSIDFLLQLCAYGDELKVDWTNKDDKDIRLLNDILNRVRSVRNDEVKA